MKKLIWLIAAALVIAPCALRAQTAGATYYVSAAGNDDNDGLTEATAFKTLMNAAGKARNGDIKTITVIGTLNQASEGDFHVDFIFQPVTDKSEVLITGVPGATGTRRAVLSAAGTEKASVFIVMSKIRFEHIEISGSPIRGFVVGIDGEVTLGEGAAVRNNSGGGVSIATIKEELRVFAKPGSLILDGGIVEGNRSAGSGAGIVVAGAFTMKRGAVRNNTSTGTDSVGGGITIESTEPVTITGGEISGNTAAYGGGVYIWSGGRVTMSGGSITNNTATRGVGGVFVDEGAVFTQQGGTISGNKAPTTTRTDTWDIYRAGGSSSGTSSGSSSSTPRPASPAPQQPEGSMSGDSDDGSASSWFTSSSSVDFGMTFLVNAYFQGWHQNLVSFGIPSSLGWNCSCPSLAWAFSARPASA